MKTHYHIRLTLLVSLVALSMTIFPAMSVFAVGSGSSGAGSSLKSNPEQDAQGYYEKGQALVVKEKHDKAANMFRKAISLKNDFAEAYNMLGFSLRKTGNYGDAIRFYKKALEFKPNFAEAHEYIGEAYLGIGDRESAWDHYTILKQMGSKKAEELQEEIDKFDDGRRK